MSEGNGYQYYITFIVKQGYALDVDIKSVKELAEDEIQKEGIEHILSLESQLQLTNSFIDYPRNSEDFIGFRYRKAPICIKESQGE